MAAAVVGIALWAATDNPNMAILFALLADLFAGLPTVIKSYQRPETESWIAYTISTIGFAVSILAIQSYSFEHAAFVIYLLIINGLLALLSLRQKV